MHQALSSTDQADNEFSKLASLPDEQIDLARGALLIAKTAYPDIDESYYLQRLNQMAAKVGTNGKAANNTLDIIPRLNRLLFEEEKLYGNSENYYDPDNSFLNQVLGVSLVLYIAPRKTGQRPFPSIDDFVQGRVSAVSQLLQKAEVCLSIVGHKGVRLSRLGSFRVDGLKIAN